jgi:hypothetical protein
MFHFNPGPSGERRPCSLGVQQDVETGQQAESGALSGDIGSYLAGSFRVARDSGAIGNRRLQLYGRTTTRTGGPLRVADPRRNRAASLLVARPSRSRPTIDHYELSVSPSRPFCNYAHRFACFVNAPSKLL